MIASVAAALFAAPLQFTWQELKLGRGTHNEDRECDHEHCASATQKRRSVMANLGLFCKPLLQGPIS